VLFRNHFAQCSPCGPARTSLLTGLYLMNHRSGRNGTPLDARHTNIALEARQAGFDPILFGHTDTSPDPRNLTPNDPRLRFYEGVLPGMTVGVHMTEPVIPWRTDLKAKGYAVPDEPMAVFAPVGTTGAADGSERPRPLYEAADSDSAFIADHLLRYFSVREHTPWFVHAVFLRPHPPLIAPEPYNTLYRLDQVPAPQRRESPAVEAAQHPYLAHLLSLQRRPGYYIGHEVDLQAIDAATIAGLRATYYALITEVDAQIGRIIARLKETGEYDHTLIVFTADHGEMLGEHWLFGKEGYFDPSYHIPMIVRDPRRQADATRGRVVDAFTESVDVMPTILDWLGREVPVQCDGQSLLPFLHGGGPKTWRREAHWEFDFRDIPNQEAETTLGLTSDQCTLCVIRDERYKYVHFPALPPLFFDLRQDPMEFHDLAADPAHQGLVLAYAQKMLSWRMAHAERVLANTFLTPDGVLERRGPRY